MRQFWAIVCVFALSHQAAGQWGASGFGNGFNSANFGSRVGGLGNAGGFSTGVGMANSTTSSAYFGSNVVGGFRTSGGLSNGSNWVSSAPIAPGFGAVAGGTNGLGTGLGIVPGYYDASAGVLPLGSAPMYAAPDLAIDLGFAPGLANYGVWPGGGYNSLTGPLPGLGYNGIGSPTLGYNALGFNSLGYNPLGYGPLGYGALGYGAIDPAALAYQASIVNQAAAAAAVNTPNAGDPSARTDSGGNSSNANGGNGSTAPRPSNPRSIRTRPGAELLPSGSSSSSGPSTTANPRVTDPVQRYLQLNPLDDSTARATPVALRIEERLHNIKTRNLRNVRVLLAGRTAVLSGSVESHEDAQLAQRVVALEPGVAKVSSTLQISSGSSPEALPSASPADAPSADER